MHGEDRIVLCRRQLSVRVVGDTHIGQHRAALKSKVIEAEELSGASRKREGAHEERREKGRKAACDVDWHSPRG